MKFKSKNFKILALILCFATMAACFAFSAFKPAVAAEAAFEENPFSEVYGYGETLNMPGSLTIVSGGENYTANKSYVRFPSGKVYAGGAIALNEFGEYALIYEAEKDGKKVTATHVFTVKMQVYSTGKNSTYAIQTLNANFGTDVKGIALNLAAGETFTYNKPVNLYENGVTELLRFNVMHFEPIGKEIVIKLTDCYDESTYIEFAYKKKVYDETYMGVGANGKASRGLTTYMNVSGGTISIDGVTYKINSDGALIPSNRQAGRHQGLNVDRYNNMTLTLDATNRDRIRAYAKTAPELVKNELIAEFNNPDMYNYTFDGFTTGEVFLSITAKTVSGADSIGLEIASMCGVSGEDLAGGTLADEKGPEIFIETEAESLNIMAGVPIAVPTAYALDPNGAGEVDYSVYYGYGTSYQKNVSVENGYFTPHDLGKYTVVYTACDVFGNKFTKTFELNAAKEGEQGIDFTCDEIERVNAGEFVSLADYTAKSLNSSAKVSVSVKGPDGKLADVSADLSMLVLSVGKYTVTYEYYDDLYSGSYSYEFTAVNGNVVRFESQKVLASEYMIKDATYSVDKVNAFKYSSATPSVVNVNYLVSYDGGEFTSFNPDNFIVGGSNTVKFRYAVADDAANYIESDLIKVVELGYKEKQLDAAKYFAGDFAGRTGESFSDHVVYSVTGSGSLKFINPLLLSQFSVRYSMSDDSIGSYTFVFTDYYDRANKATIKFESDGVVINGVKKNNVYSASGSTLTVSMDDEGGLTIGSDRYDYDFGFISDKMLFGVEFENVSASCDFNVYSVCNQTLGYYVTADNVKPLISVEHADKVAKLGDTITLHKPEYADVLSPSVRSNCTISVYKDGVSLKSTSGVLLKDADAFAGYTFDISGFGSYLVIYYYTDGAGKVTDDRFEISAIDVVAPEVKLNGYDGNAVSIAVGEDVAPIAYTVSDNISSVSDINVTIVVYNKKGVAVCVGKESFKVTEKGSYTVYIYCTDEAGNTSYASYQVTAK